MTMSLAAIEAAEGSAAAALILVKGDMSVATYPTGPVQTADDSSLPYLTGDYGHTFHSLIDRQINAAGFSKEVVPGADEDWRGAADPIVEGKCPGETPKSKCTHHITLHAARRTMARCTFGQYFEEYCEHCLMVR